ncbi:hypothetical protein SAMN02910447_02164 [Ruminococcus sp. YE71]|uniref:DUF6440 family protein n=1 Tax=unclassified Ruminococcus TaxID=2608920 RepID=UPI0008879418|nr:MULTISPECIES: DUF6440 family protein [unclassified Ruminococcus]SDA22181.1 hypothetical protein SAMN02910446_02033 [Ruminococcus sp. YE78]SFW37596.1 hypothetical protein SAMN02910447_02164 [Ruminococcus sp. YE71]
MAKNDNKRFVKVFGEGSLVAKEIYVDRETGINYLFIAEGYAGGLTPLLGRDGKPVITPINDFDE